MKTANDILNQALAINVDAEDLQNACELQITTRRAIKELASIVLSLATLNARFAELVRDHVASQAKSENPTK